MHCYLPVIHSILQCFFSLSVQYETPIHIPHKWNFVPFTDFILFIRTTFAYKLLILLICYLESTFHSNSQCSKYWIHFSISLYSTLSYFHPLKLNAETAIVRYVVQCRLWIILYLNESEKLIHWLFFLFHRFSGLLNENLYFTYYYYQLIIITTYYYIDSHMLMHTKTKTIIIIKSVDSNCRKLHSCP